MIYRFYLFIEHVIKRVHLLCFNRVDNFFSFIETRIFFILFYRLAFNFIYLHYCRFWHDSIFDFFFYFFFYISNFSCWDFFFSIEISFFFVLINNKTFLSFVDIFVRLIVFSIFDQKSRLDSIFLTRLDYKLVVLSLVLHNFMKSISKSISWRNRTISLIFVNLF